MIKVNNIKLPLEYTSEDIKASVSKSLRINPKAIDRIKLCRVSIDARKKDNIHYLATVAVKLNTDEKNVLKKNKSAEIYTPYRYCFNPTKKLLTNPVIVGSGPAGLFAALTLARYGNKPIVIERGKDVDRRTEDIDTFFKLGILKNNSNIQFGEGGAGTFSDGKLNTGTNDSRATHVLETFVEHGAQEEILINAKPHIGTDILKNVIKNIRNEIIESGGTFLFETTVTDIMIKDNKVNGVAISADGKKDIIETETVLLAIGHSARDTFEMLMKKGIFLEQKPFSMGVRVEHLAYDINKSQYGDSANKLPTADYKLNTKDSNGRGVYTFCMCPGGYVVNASSEDGRLCTNGMSYSKRDGKNSNAAVLVSVFPSDLDSDSPLAGIALQRNLEEKAYIAGGSDNCAPVETVGSFLKNGTNKVTKVKPTIKPGYNMSKISSIFPEYINRGLTDGLAAFAKKLSAFSADSAVLTAAETRSSSPVRIIRNEKYQALNIQGLYPCGEGAGYAGGIISAAVDGIKCAEMIMTK